MGELVELRSRSRTSNAPQAGAFRPSAHTFVLIPNERFSDLRQFWIDLKADIAEVDEPSHHLTLR